MIVAKIIKSWCHSISI